MRLASSVLRLLVLVLIRIDYVFKVVIALCLNSVAGITRKMALRVYRSFAFMFLYLCFVHYFMESGIEYAPL